MQELSHFSALQKIQKADLPSRVLEEVFPIFETIISPEMELVIGVSSGVDSMTLACLLILRWYDKKFLFQHLHIVHCNHQIREQSKKEAAYISTFFAGMEVQIFERPAPIKTTEKALREWRYQCFNTASATF
jgi:tRNA(Ile)-lysidine synthase TilS/MesJ